MRNILCYKRCSIYVVGVGYRGNNKHCPLSEDDNDISGCRRRRRLRNLVLHDFTRDVGQRKEPTTKDERKFIAYNVLVVVAAVFCKQG